MPVPYVSLRSTRACEVFQARSSEFAVARVSIHVRYFIDDDRISYRSPDRLAPKLQCPNYIAATRTRAIVTIAKTWRDVYD